MKYAKDQARWLFPLPPKQLEKADQEESGPSRLDSELHEMVDKELDEPVVRMPNLFNSRKNIYQC